MEYQNYHILSQLLASENINTVFGTNDGSIASFDLIKRILRIAVLEDSQKHLMNGLIIHEVGHALFTNPYSDKDFERRAKIQKLMNIIEDGYQERQICKKFPGAKKYLYQVFEEFFINEPEEDIDFLPINYKLFIQTVNTLNYNCKGNKFNKTLPYPNIINSNDLHVLKQAEVLSDPIYANRLTVAEKVKDVLLKIFDIDDEELIPEYQQSHNSNGEQNFESNDSNEQSESNEQPKSSDSNNSSNSESKSKSADSDGSDNESNNSSDSSSNNSSNKIDNCTDDKSSNSIDNSSDGGNSSSGGINDIFSELNDYINDHHEKFNISSSSNNIATLPSYKELKNLSKNLDIIDFNNGRINPNNEIKKHKKIARKIFTVFNTQKYARNLASTQYKKSGVLDTNRLAHYKITDDIFKKTAIQPNQINHGIVFMIDWSGSMDSSLHILAKKITELAFFCEMANVELEIILYTTNNIFNKKSDFLFESSKFIKVLNTSYHRGQGLVNRLNKIFKLIHYLRSSSNNLKFEYDTYGTNILESVIYGHGRLEELKADKKRLIVLTDGEDQLWPEHTTNRIFFNNIKLNGVNRFMITKEIIEYYHNLGQPTLGIGWGHSAKLFDTNIYVNNKIPKYETSNEFINELVNFIK